MSGTNLDGRSPARDPRPPGADGQGRKPDEPGQGLPDYDKINENRLKAIQKGMELNKKAKNP